MFSRCSRASQLTTPRLSAISLPITRAAVSRAWQEGGELSGTGDHCQVRHGGRAGGVAEGATGNARTPELPLTIELATGSSARASLSVGGARRMTFSNLPVGSAMQSVCQCRAAMLVSTQNTDVSFSPI